MNLPLQVNPVQEQPTPMKSMHATQSGQPFAAAMAWPGAVTATAAGPALPQATRERVKTTAIKSPVRFKAHLLGENPTLDAECLPGLILPSGL
jgi:hypothetical protein